MINATISHIIATVTVILLLLFSLYLLSIRKKKLTHNLLAIFFLANSLYLIDYLLNPIQQVFEVTLSWFKDIGFSFAFLFGPLIFLFVRSIIKKKLELRLNMIWHIIPFLFFFTAYSLSNNLFCEYGYLVLFIQLFTYYTIALKDIITYRTNVKAFFSDFGGESLIWIIYALFAFIITSLIDFASAILAFLHLDNATTRANLNFFSVLFNFAYIVYIFYKLLNLPERLIGYSEQLIIEKYSNSKLTKEEKNKILKKIENYFAREKPYLSPDLTINHLSTELDISMRDISQVLNQFCGKNFYDFVNSYRINEAKKLLLEEENKKETILEILYKSGFNTKSSFNTAFKRYTGLTPTQYRQSNKFSG